MKRLTIENVSGEAWLSLLLLSTLFLTNRYLSLPTDAPWVEFAGGDSYSYLAMANAFPSLPRGVGLPLHHAQRIVIPYVLGSVVWLFGVPTSEVFRVFAMFTVLAIVVVFHRILGVLALPPEPRMILLGLLILNPYVFRYYLAIPWMVSDLGFHLGVALLLLGLLRQRPGLTFAGVLVATLAKQTGLVLLPGVMGWIWWRWSGSRGVKIAECVGLAVAGGLVYEGTTWLVQPLFGHSLVLRHLTGFFRWLAEQFSVTTMSVFAARGVVGFVFPAALFLSLAVTRALPSRWWKNRGLLWCLALAGSIALQPALGGPVVTGHSVTRLAMLAYLPLLVGLANVLADTGLSAPVRRRLVFVTTWSMTIGSFHHFYSFLGVLDTGRAGTFLSVYAASALLLFLGSIVSQRVGLEEG